MFTKNYHAEARVTGLKRKKSVEFINESLVICDYPIIRNRRLAHDGIPQELLTLRPKWHCARALGVIVLDRGNGNFWYRSALQTYTRKDGWKIYQSPGKLCVIEDLFVGASVSMTLTLPMKDAVHGQSEKLIANINMGILCGVIDCFQMSLRTSTKQDLVWVELVPADQRTILIATTRYSKEEPSMKRL